MPSYLDAFYERRDGLVFITPQQASDFAKSVAGDFNPLHDPDNRRFCVPGDLLFCLILQHYGISQQMQFRFTNMVGANVGLVFPKQGQIYLSDNAGRIYLEAERQGEVSQDSALVDQLTRDYAAFSGQNFPHILVPLLQAKNVMVNPQRPLVMYAGMAFEFSRWPTQPPQLQFSDAQLSIDGKRGDVRLKFDFLDQGQIIGRGEKQLIISGLRPYEQAVVDDLIAQYDSWKAAYTPS